MMQKKVTEILAMQAMKLPALLAMQSMKLPALLQTLTTPLPQIKLYLCLWRWYACFPSHKCLCNFYVQQEDRTSHP